MLVNENEKITLLKAITNISNIYFVDKILGVENEEKCLSDQYS